MLGASFQIGRSALAAYQSAIGIAGQNIANVGNPNYTRMTGHLQTLEGGPTLGGAAPGGGVYIASLDRHADSALEARLRSAFGSRSHADTTYQTLREVEALYNELTEYDLSTQLAGFFNAFSDLQNDPDELTARNLVLSETDAVLRTMHRQRDRLLQQAHDLNAAVEQNVTRANEIAGEIAHLNELIVVQSSRGGGHDAPLRDRRDTLLRELGEMMDIQVRERQNGSMNVYVGSEPLVEFSRSRGLHVETVLEDGLERATVRFSDTNGTVIIRDGQLAAQLAGRDAHLIGQVDALDELARALIYEVNRVHSGGRGTVGYESLRSEYAVADRTQPLNSTEAGLAFPIENGSFIVHLRNRETGQETTRLIEVDLDGIGQDTSLDSLRQELAGVPGLSAAVSADNRLELTADGGYEVWFSEDSSGALAALGIGSFFTGTDAATIDIAGAVRSDPRLIAASLSGEPGDGGNAGRLAVLGDAASSLLRGQTIQGFQSDMVTQVAIDASAAMTNYEAADAVYASLVAQREAISGVSLDEEAINLAKYEQAYSGAARYLGVLDGLSNEVLSLVR